MTTAPERLAAALADRYVIDRELGAGGMATVYLAEDLKHHRKVAIKVLRPELAAVIGAERFLAEIRTTANLQHPHILALIDSGETDGMLWYVMPYVSGESLRDRITREKQLPVADAVRIATEVAGALDYAHRHNVIHRDIKPENILLHDGSALVADFGIALAASSGAGTRMTETGMSLGTPHYMSPEQAMGEREITARSDVYALGCITYEMLVGEPPFNGPTAQAIIARVMTEEPRALTMQRKTIPPGVEAAIFTALEKLPADRFATAAEFAAALADPGYISKSTVAQQVDGSGPAMVRGWQARLRDPVTIGLGVIALAALGGVYVLGRRPDTTAVVPPIRFVINTPDSTRPSSSSYPWPAAISPDGSLVVYSVAQAGSGTSFYLLRTDQLEAHPISGTTNAYQPYFSPDGQWLAFEMDGKERKIRFDGSAPVAITDASGANGATWLVGDEIVLGSQGGGLHGLSRVSAAGGTAVALTQPDTAKGERDHLWPIGLPDGKNIVFTVWSGTLASAQLAITSLENGKVTPLGIAGIRPLAVVDGALVYVQADGAVMAARLNAGKQRLDGLPIPVHDPIPIAGANNGNSGIYVSNGGALVTSRGGSLSKLSSVALDGRSEPVLSQPRGFDTPRFSPDERRIAVIVHDGPNADIWIYDRTLATFSRLTSAGTVTSVEWAPDGSHLIFSAGGSSSRAAVWMQAFSGGAPAEMLFETGDLTPSATMSPDGRSLLLTALNGSSWDIRRVPLDSERVARSYLATGANEREPKFSPDGRWVAMTSNESGRSEVYVRSFPDPSSRIQVSVTGGTEPVWSRDGGRLYYRAGSALLSARITVAPTFTLLSRDTVLSNVAFLTSAFFGANYDVPRDGKHVLANLTDADDFQLVVSPNWITELRRRIAESGGKK